MKALLDRLWSDESGFIVSAELVLISTVLVIGLIVGLSEVQHSVVTELNDVADAIGTMNQTYLYSGLSSRKRHGREKAFVRGSRFFDHRDACDNNECEIACAPPVPERPKR